jgi:hypothetical protein
MPLNCGNCSKCEDILWGSFYPGEEWKMKYFEGYTFEREGVWFFADCPHRMQNGMCGAHDQTWRPLQCKSYPCYINWEGEVEVDFDLCHNAYQIDDEFKANVKKMYDELNLSLEDLGRWGKIVCKYSEPSKRKPCNMASSI